MSDQNTQKNIANATPEKQAEMISQLGNLKTSKGWVLLMQVFEKNIKHLEQLILEKKWLDGKVATEDQMDLLRAKYGYMKDLRNAPDNLIEQLKVQPEAVVGDLDPYYKDMKDVDFDRSKEAEQDG